MRTFLLCAVLSAVLISLPAIAVAEEGQFDDSRRPKLKMSTREDVPYDLGVTGRFDGSVGMELGDSDWEEYYFQQINLSAISVTQYVTSGYARGTPSAWVIDVPNLRGAPGWDTDWELQAGTPVEWTVTAFGGRAELLLGAMPEDGEFIRYAIRHSDPAAVAVTGPGNIRNGSLRSVYTNRLRLPTP